MTTDTKPIQAHSLSEYKRLDAMGTNVKKTTAEEMMDKIPTEEALNSYLQKAYTMGFADGQKGQLHAPERAKFIEDWNKENLEKEKTI